MARLIKWGEVPVVDRGGGIWSVAFSNPPLEGQPFIMGVTAFPPGTSIALHSHNTVEQVTVLAGKGWAELNGERTPVRPFDTTQIAPGEWHRFINSDAGEMKILWVYGSTEVTRTFPDGRTVPQFES